jgi:hypothetical protein
LDVVCVASAASLYAFLFAPPSIHVSLRRAHQRRAPLSIRLRSRPRCSLRKRTQKVSLSRSSFSSLLSPVLSSNFTPVPKRALTLPSHVIAARSLIRRHSQTPGSHTVSIIHHKVEESGAQKKPTGCLSLITRTANNLIFGHTRLCSWHIIDHHTMPPR